MELDIIIQNFIEQYGVFSVFIIVLLEYSNLPIPSEIVLPAVGVLVAGGSISMIEAIVSSVLAGLLGSIINYYFGYYLGKSLIKKMVKISPKLQKSVDVSMWWIQKYGEASVMISRVIPLVRTFISIPAGVIRMNMLKFISYSSLGIFIWNTSLICLGFMCGNNMSLIASILKRYSIGVMFIVVLGVFLYYFSIKLFQRNKEVKKCLKMSKTYIQKK